VRANYGHLTSIALFFLFDRSGFGWTGNRRLEQEQSDERYLYGYQLRAVAAVATDLIGF
jgi:hypothetical protein